MEIIKQQLGDVLELQVKGRLDNYWSDFFAGGLAAAIQEGSHHLRLDLSDVTFLSSAGIGILVRFHQQLQAIQGTFVISKASPRVRSVLKLVALEPLLLGDSTQRSATVSDEPAQRLDVEGARFEIYELNSKSPVECRLVGDPTRISSDRYGASDCRTRSFAEDTIALGLGAFGEDYEDCRGRFGEFISVAGCSAHLPTDGSYLPDFLISAQGLATGVQVLYGLEMRGTPSLLVRFDVQPDYHISLSRLAKQCLQVSGKMSLAFAMIAEASNLVGIALRTSPDGDPAQRFAFPQMRDWMTFSPGVSGRNTAVVVGVCGYDCPPPLALFVRPLDIEGHLVGHFHAATFPYRPVQRGRIGLSGVVRDIFQSHAILSLLHLVNDSRKVNGAGESEFLRGACWIAPVKEPEVEA
jgi:anti-anti-sigma factor